MRKRQNNVLHPSLLESNQTIQVVTVLSLAETKMMFLAEVRGLAANTQRWHREILTEFEKVLAKQQILILDCWDLTARLLKNHFVFYMRDDLGLKTNPINGWVRTVRALIHFLFKEGYLEQDISTDIPILRGENVIIQTFSEEQIQRLLTQHDKRFLLVIAITP